MNSLFYVSICLELNKDSMDKKFIGIINRIFLFSKKFVRELNENVC